MPGCQMKKFRENALEQKIQFSEKELKKDSKYYKLRLKAEIAKAWWGYKYYYQIILQEDIQIKKSMKLFDLARSLSRKEGLKIN